MLIGTSRRSRRGTGAPSLVALDRRLAGDERVLEGFMRRTATRLTRIDRTLDRVEERLVRMSDGLDLESLLLEEHKKKKDHDN